MKIAGNKIEGPNTEMILLPRGDNPPIVLRAQAVLDYTPFDTMCPRPKPPSVIRPGGIRETNPEDPRHVEALHNYARKRMAWIVLTSLRLGSPELEWETVDFGNSNTWLKYEDELKEAGFAEIEVGRIIRACMIANCLDDDKLDEARKAFLLSQRLQAEQLSSQEDEPQDTPSGEPASDSA